MNLNPQEAAARWSEYVAKAIGALTNKEVADRIGASDTTVGNWLDRDKIAKPDAYLVVAFARAFSRAVPDALVAAGVAEESEFSETVVVRREVTDMSAEEMINQIIMILARIRELVDAAPPVNPGDSPRKRKRRFSVRGDIDPL